MDPIIVNGIVGIGTATLAWLFTKKKQDAETKVTEATAHTSELDATEKAVAIWRGLAQDLKTEVDELRSLISELREENDKLHQEINKLRDEIQKERLLSGG